MRIYAIKDFLHNFMNSKAYFAKNFYCFIKKKTQPDMKQRIFHFFGSSQKVNKIS